MSEPLAVREAPASYVLDAHHVRSGYKQTDLGIIPEDWDAIPMGRVGECLIGLTYSPQDVCDFGTLVLRSSNVQNGRLEFEDNVYVDMEIPQRAITKENDILICVRNGSRQLIGKCALIDAKTAGSAFGAFMSVLRSESAKFLFFQFQSNILKRQIEEVMGATINQITNRDMAGFKVIWPPTKVEQEAIAEVLSDADALIDALEQLVAKKRHLKQGAMQELLTGKKRLPGFSGEWEAKCWGDVIVHCSSGATPYRGRPDFYKGDIKWISSGELNYNIITDTLEHISKDAVEKTNLRIHPVGTFLMAITGLEAAGTRGACGIVGSPATTNQSCMAVYPTPDLLTEYLYHYYIYRGDELALKYCQGTKQQSYTAQLIRILPIHLPPTVDEQTAIATILFDMDTEIAALEQQLAKARGIKQGMMQELLTGKIRLV